MTPPTSVVWPVGNGGGSRNGSWPSVFSPPDVSEVSNISVFGCGGGSVAAAGALGSTGDFGGGGRVELTGDVGICVEGVCELGAVGAGVANCGCLSADVCSGNGCPGGEFCSWAGELGG